jgi:HSP20 family protein
MANITRYNPFNEVVSLREAMDRLFEDSIISRNRPTGSDVVASNLYETSDAFVLQMPLAGVNPDQIEITAQENTLMIKWETDITVPENATTHWKSFISSQYQQSFTLPMPTDPQRISATYENGILSVHLPKTESSKARTIKVQSSNPKQVSQQASSQQKSGQQIQG